MLNITNANTTSTPPPNKYATSLAMLPNNTYMNTLKNPKNLTPTYN
jgi:hypothetical protein